MSETDYKDLEIGDVDENGQNVLISRVADRPNAFNSYRDSKMSAADVKAMFDRPFLHVKAKVNKLIAFLAGRDQAVEEKLTVQNEKVDEVYTAFKNGDLNGKDYIFTDDDKQDIVNIMLTELDGNDVSYTGEEVSVDG